MNMKRRGIRASAIAMWAALAGCANDDLVQADPIVDPCAAGPDVRVSGTPMGEQTVFDWDPPCPMSALLVERGGWDVWGVSTDEHSWDDPIEANRLEPPVTYGVVPRGTQPTEIDDPPALETGSVYELYLRRVDGSSGSLACRYPYNGSCAVGLGEFIAGRAPPAMPRIAFSAQRDSVGPFPYDIYVVNEDGSDLRMITGGDRQGLAPVWSPFGVRLAYATWSAGRFWIRVSTDEGLDSGLLYNGRFPDSWSPDGGAILYGGGNGLFTVSIPGGRTVQLLESEFLVSDADWHADGRIVFAATEADMSSGDIVVRHEDGSTAALTADPWIDLSPRWSPDGRGVAYASYRDDGWEIRLIDADGNNARRVTAGRSPAWSPDGSRIVFEGTEDGLFLVRVDGSDLRRLTDFGSYPHWSN